VRGHGKWNGDHLAAANSPVLAGRVAARYRCGQEDADADKGVA
jgi:hypothetical protein